MAPFTYSVLRPQALSPALSTGYTDAAIAFLPLGRFIRAASHIKALDDAHATSRVLRHRNFQVRRCMLGRDAGSVTSASVRSITVLSLFFAASQRLSCSAVNTSLGLSNSPLPTTIWLPGTL